MTLSPYPYKERFQSERLLELFKHFPVVVISGGRQVGKSTLLEHLFSKIPRVVFDPVQDVEGARRDPDLFLKNRKRPLILDEIQYAPEVIPAIKQLLEKDRSPGQFLITGSQQWGVMKLLSESLAGRAVFMDLDGFSLHEIENLHSSKTPWLSQWLSDPTSFLERKIKKLELPFSLTETLWRGGLPEAQFIPKNLVPTFHEAYQKTYVERDIRHMENISDLPLFGKFFRLVGALTAQEINYSQIGRELGISPQTATRWLQLFQATFMWFEIAAYSGNVIKRIHHKPKGYLNDTGLACWSMAISTPEAILSHPQWGAIFETAVVLEIRKQARLLDVAPNFYHWRTNAGAEVDLILEWNGKFYPFEMKCKSHPTRTDASGILSFRKTYPHLSIAPGLILSPSDTAYPLSENDWVLPWDASLDT